MTVWKRLGIVASWTVLLMLVAWLDIWLWANHLTRLINKNPMGEDFIMYYSAARALRLNPHANIYLLGTLRAAYTGGCSTAPQTTYPYQPLLALLLEPVTVLRCDAALFLWWQLSFVLWGIIVYWFVADATRKYGAGRGLLVGALCIGFLPIWHGLAFGQIHLLILFLFVLASRLAATKRLGAAGGVLAVGVFFKYLPVFLIAYHFVRGHLRVVIWAAVVGSILLIGELIAVGPAILVASIGGATADVATYSRQSTSWMHNIPAGSSLAWLAVALTFGAVLWGTWRKWSGSEALGEGWALCAMLLVSPLPWLHYLTWLLPTLIAVTHAALDYTGGWRVAVWRSMPWVEAAKRIIPLAVLASAWWLLNFGGTPLDVGIALFLVWGLCGAFYVASAERAHGASLRLPNLRQLLVAQSAK